MRLKKQITLLVVLLIAIAAVIGLSFMHKNSNQADGTELSSSGGTEDMDLPDDDTEGSGTGGLTRQYLLENYGMPDENESFEEVLFEDGMGSSLDFDRIAGLKVYRAQPCYSENELMEELIARFGIGKDSYSISRRDYSAMTEGDVVGWGNYYTYTDESGNIFAKGSTVSVDFSWKSLEVQVDSGEQKQFLLDLVEECHLGIWESDSNLLQPFTSRALNNALDGLDGMEYTAKLEIDGIEVADVNANINVTDEDGARYSALGYGDLTAVFEEEGFLDSISRMMAADITESSELRYAYNSLDDIADVMNLSLNTGAGSGTSSVYLLGDAELMYARGLCEDGTFLLAPWLVFEGQVGIYFENEGKWQVCSCELYLNLNTGDVYGN